MYNAYLQANGNEKFTIFLKITQKNGKFMIFLKIT